MERTLRSFFFFVLLCRTVSAAGQTPITSVQEALEASDEAYARQCPFRLHGKISANGLSNSALFRDESGTALVRFGQPNKSFPIAGSIVTIDGKLRLGDYGGHRLCALSYTILRQEKPDPPVDMSIRELVATPYAPRFVRTTGTVIEVYPDEVDANYTYIILFDGGASVYIAAYNQDYAYDDLLKLINAKVQITGLYRRSTYWRRFTPPYFESPASLRVISPAPDDPFDLVPLDLKNRHQPIPDPIGTRRRTQGTVHALWQGNKVVLFLRNGLPLQVHLNRNSEPPAFGQTVNVAGLIDSNGSTLIMRDAIWKPADFAALALDEPVDIEAKNIFLDSRGKPAIQYVHQGKTIRLVGKVLAMQSLDKLGSRFLLDCNGFTVPVDANGSPPVVRSIKIGSTVSVTGICLIDFENWRFGAPLPRIHGIHLVIRQPEDIVILKNPSPLTAKRLLVVIGLLLLAIVFVLIWNRALKILVERRSREVIRAQTKKLESELRIGERTRLAADLHDNTVQNLTAIAYRITAAQGALGDREPEAGRILDVAAKMLKSCRTSLRQCLWDLRNDALNETDFGTAIRRTVETVAGDARLSVRFSGRRDLINDTTAHAILSILRELVANATVHGNADSVSIAGEAHPGVIHFSVSDSGTGFDPARRPGQDEGHFGIDGIQERLESLNGTMDIESSVGKGTYVRITIQRT